jgi:ABC-type dipeptide/oligopeptide/nickel transport system ATPase component
MRGEASRTSCHLRTDLRWLCTDMRLLPEMRSAHISFSITPLFCVEKVPAGETIAFVGASGAGKSTIARLLFRFYDLRDSKCGRICIDGERAGIAIAPQRSSTARHPTAQNKSTTSKHLHHKSMVPRANGFQTVSWQARKDWLIHSLAVVCMHVAGTDIKRVTQESLRMSIGVVPQDAGMVCRDKEPTSQRPRERDKRERVRGHTLVSMLTGGDWE